MSLAADRSDGELPGQSSQTTSSTDSSGMRGGLSRLGKELGEIEDVECTRLTDKKLRSAAPGAMFVIVSY